MHLFDQALNWHWQFIKKYTESAPWALYEYELLNRFGKVYEDPLVELKNLKHTGSVQAYLYEYELTCMIKLV